MNCKHCGSPNVKKNGHYKGRQRYRCKDCGKSCTAGDRPRGGQPIGDRPMTGAERWRRWRDKHRAVVE